MYSFEKFKYFIYMITTIKSVCGEFKKKNFNDKYGPS